jgi:chemotaxis signal transduction protein
VEIATFYINDQWYGVEVDNVIEAIKVEEMLKIPTDVETVLGSCFFEDEVIIILDPSKLLGDGKQIEEINEVVVIESNKGRFGLVVSALGKIPSIDNRRLNKETDLLAKTSRVIKHIISPEVTEKFEKILIVLEPNEIYDALTGDDDFDFESKPSKPTIAWSN